MRTFKEFRAGLADGTIDAFSLISENKKSGYFIKFTKDSDLNFAYCNLKKLGYVKKVDPKNLILQVSIPGDATNVSKLIQSLSIEQKNFSIKAE